MLNIGIKGGSVSSCRSGLGKDFASLCCMRNVQCLPASVPGVDTSVSHIHDRPHVDLPINPPRININMQTHKHRAQCEDILLSKCLHVATWDSYSQLSGSLRMKGRNNK